MFCRQTNYHTIATSEDLDPEEVLPCPYDISHRIRRKRFPHHIMKCKRNFPLVVLDTCPFNARHLVPKHELRHHMSICPGKTALEQDLVRLQGQSEEGAYFKGNTDVPSYHNPEFQMPSPTENWDLEAEENHAMYPTDNRWHNGYMATNELMTPAERKHHNMRLKEEALRRVSGRPSVPEEGDPDYENYIREQELEAQFIQETKDKPLRKPREPPRVLQQQNGIDNGHPKIAANIFGPEVKPDDHHGPVPSEDMFMKASRNIASVYNQSGKTSNSVLGQAAKATATSAYLEEINRIHPLAIMPSPTTQGGLLRIAPGFETTPNLPYSMPATQMPVPNAVVSSLSAVAAALCNNSIPQISPVSKLVDEASGQLVVSQTNSVRNQGVSPFLDVPVGLGRGRGRGIMDLLAEKKPGSSMNNQGPVKKKAARNGGLQQEWPTPAESTNGVTTAPQFQDMQNGTHHNQTVSMPTTSQARPPLPPGVVSAIQPSGETKQSGDATEAKRQKKVHKLNKKLRQINSLEEKQKAGVKMNEEEMQKILKKERIVEKLAKLTLGDDSGDDI
ncbi:uncharacterized protein LOC144445137 isoform X2 [Glandiceps talaboti]